MGSIELTFYKQGNFTLAENTLIEAMNVSESLRGRLKDKEKVSIFDTQSNTYRHRDNPRAWAAFTLIGEAE